MPQWNPEEIRQIEALTAEIAGYKLQRRRASGSGGIALKLSEGLTLADGLAGSTRALIVRQLLRALGFDEHRHLQWRMEHKLVQALVLHQWIPESIPITGGLSALAWRHGPDELRRFLTESYPGGYVIKAALGDSSGEAPDREDGDRRLRAIESTAALQPHMLVDETYVVQERIAIVTEYRVHSIEEDIIPDLTFRRYDAGSIVGERDAPNDFVREILRRLPDALVGGTLLAWDIALQASGGFAIIEANFSGFHPVFKRGFHCSGYFHDQHWGSCDTARLLNHVAQTDGIEVTARADAPDHPIENRFYSEVANWQLRHGGHDAPLPRRQIDSASLDFISEDALLEPLICEIEGFETARRRGPAGGEIELRLSCALPLLPQLAASARALPLRQVLLALGFDERRLPGWRFEHKLVQALVFRHYAGESLPLTRGFDRLTQGVNARDLRGFLNEQFPCGFVIKTALGDCSGNEIGNRTEAALSWMESGGRFTPGPGTLTDEEFIVQERKAIRREYRVHTIEDRVIADLTVHRHQGTVAPGERQGPNDYVQRMLNALPAAITSGAHLGWDIALLDDGSLATIEVNIGGIHTRWNPGFHASGFFHHKGYGAIYTARLLLFLEQTYRCRINVVADAPEHFDEQYFYSEVADWKSRF